MIAPRESAAIATTITITHGNGAAAATAPSDEVPVCVVFGVDPSLDKGVSSEVGGVELFSLGTSLVPGKAGVDFSTGLIGFLGSSKSLQS